MRAKCETIVRTAAEEYDRRSTAAAEDHDGLAGDRMYYQAEALLVAADVIAALTPPQPPAAD
jgi:hypothetical protein